MAELTETDLISKISVIDEQIATIVATLGTSGLGGAQYVDHSLGNKSIDGSQRLEQLMATRKMYQELLNQVPKTVTRDHGYEVEPLTGRTPADLVGDE